MKSVCKLALIALMSVSTSFAAVSNSSISERVSASFGAGERPENARPGQCFAKVIIPAKFKYVNEKVLVSSADTQVSTVPAKYGYETKRVLVREASERQITVPATYKYESQKVLVQEQSERLVQIPATYKTVSKRILVSPESTEWKKGEQPSANSVNEALCLVKKPAQYKTVYEKVMVSPARTETKVIPAVYNTVQKRVVDRAAFVKTVPVPAEYKTVRVRKMLEAPRTVEKAIPARFQNVSKKIKVSESATEWREVLCKTNANSSKIAKVQRALRKAGFFNGRVDGLLGNNTAGAVKRYQQAKNLPTGGLTFETIKDLNINI